MNKAKLTTGLIFLILLVSIIQWPQVKAITPQNQTISITDTHDDRFITETGIGIDSQLCGILDPNMDIRSFLVFRELEINWWEPLKNATLRLRTTVNLDFDNESSVTICGMKFSELQDEGILSSSFVLSVPLTSARINVNTSQLYGQQWHEINVTSIVGELISSIHWDGHGLGGTETGDSIGFVILGAEGHDTRWFIDYLYGTPSLAPQLVLHWNHAPPPPVGYEDAVFNETYLGYDIWEVPADPWYNGSLYDLDLTQNFENTSYHELDTGDRMTIVNSTHFNVVNLDGMISNRYYRDDYPEYTTAIALVHQNVTDIDDGGADGTWEYPYSVVGFGQGAGSQWTENRVDLVVGHHYDDDKRFVYWIHQGGAGAGDFIAGSSSGWVYAPQEFWIIFEWNGTTSKAGYVIYNSSSMSDEDVIINKRGITIEDQGAPFDSVTFWNAPGGGLGAGHVWGDIYMPTGDRLGITYVVSDENGTVLVKELDSVGDAEDWIDNYDPDPEDPDPAGEWSTGPGGETGAFTRFRMRLWFLAIGFGCLFGPIIFFAWRRPSGYYILCGAIVMLIGIGMLLSIGQV